ncbi:5-formyltetrahydrofolate cyclo-ligase [Thalassobacillus pellis]|uniref:5-formyltetrahydrofolate cyclo-ligase n=1 Tax=Thalassobacillus pellis TaxID=748008 RepID=UPI00195F4AC7|nr:5-formyltetrahydrofolate cyclo-ligase [Thalassobacillus pellis]MBM7552281.1 5-formyltetrahydrofolate cyclo-ligase [Thalassobacillus pellis]
MQKDQLRARGKKILASFSNDEKKKLEHSLKEHLTSSKLWNEAETIGMTISQEHEWSTYPLIETGWAQGKTIVVPKCDPAPKELHFHQLTDFSELEIVYFGLKEPNPEKTAFVRKENIDLLLVPGLLFDLKGYRIGYGGGFYDRYLSDYKGETVALASEEQVVKELPYENFDIPIQHLITDKGFVY